MLKLHGGAALPTSFAVSSDCLEMSGIYSISRASTAIMSWPDVTPIDTTGELAAPHDYRFRDKFAITAASP